MLVGNGLSEVNRPVIHMKLHLRRYYRILQNKFEKKILFTFNYLWYILSMIEFALITLVLYNTQVW